MDMGRLKRMAAGTKRSMRICTSQKGMGNWSNTLHLKTKVQIVIDVA
jgi:hypothetical protein